MASREYYSSSRDAESRNYGVQVRPRRQATYQQGAYSRAPGRKPVKKKKKFRIFSATGIMLLAILVAIAGGIIYLAFFKDKEKTISMTETPITQAMTKVNTGSGMLYQAASSSGGSPSFNYYDWSKPSRNYTYEMGVGDLRMSGSSDGLSVVYTENELLVVGTQTPVSFTGRILSVECGKEHIAMLREDSAGGESVLILSKSGEQIDQLLADGQFIVNFGFYSTTSEMLWMETLSVSAGVPITVITTYDLTRRTSTGVMEIQDQLVDSLYFSSNSIFVVGTNQIIRYSMESKEMYKEMIYGYQVLDFSSASGTPTFLLAPREGNMNSIRILTLAEAESSSASSTYLQLPGEGVAGYIMNGALIVVTEKNVYTYTLKGKQSATAVLQLSADEAIKISDSMLLLSHNGTYYTAKVR